MQLLLEFFALQNKTWPADEPFRYLQQKSGYVIKLSPFNFLEGKKQ